MRPNSGVWLTKERLEDRLLSSLDRNFRPYKESLKEVARIKILPKQVVIREDVRDKPAICYEWRL